MIGWFQGRAEFGPRALGYRSVLADPRDASNRKRINDVLKRRDWFMPFAPSIMLEDAPDYLKTIKESPFMILADEATEKAMKEIPATVHVDGTLRPHTVDRNVNPLYWEVIKNFKEITGTSVVLNTSFNKHGLPIVHSPKDAIEHLLWDAIDELVIADFIVNKR